MENVACFHLLCASCRHPRSETNRSDASPHRLGPVRVVTVAETRFGLISAKRSRRSSRNAEQQADQSLLLRYRGLSAEVVLYLVRRGRRSVSRREDYSGCFHCPLAVRRTQELGSSPCAPCSCSRPLARAERKPDRLLVTAQSVRAQSLCRMRCQRARPSPFLLWNLFLKAAGHQKTFLKR